GGGLSVAPGHVGHLLGGLARQHPLGRLPRQASAVAVAAARETLALGTGGEEAVGELGAGGRELVDVGRGVDPSEAAGPVDHFADGGRAGEVVALGADDLHAVVIAARDPEYGVFLLEERGRAIHRVGVDAELIEVAEEAVARM